MCCRLTEHPWWQASHGSHKDEQITDDPALYVGNGIGRDILSVLQGCSPTVKDRDGCTPLYCAAAWNRMEAVRKLESLGGQAGVRSQEGRTPVHVAAEQVILASQLGISGLMKEQGPPEWFNPAEAENAFTGKASLATEQGLGQ